MLFELAKISFKAYSNGQIVPAVKYALGQAFNKYVILIIGKKPLKTHAKMIVRTRRKIWERTNI